MQVRCHVCGKKVPEDVVDSWNEEPGEVLLCSLCALVELNREGESEYSDIRMFEGLGSGGAASRPTSK